MKKNERYKRLLKIIFGAILILGFSSIYGFTWIGYYNRYVLQIPFFRRGNWVIILLYAVLLTFFIHTYGGFKVAYLKNSHLFYSQMISVILVNMFTYLQIAVIDKRFVSPMYILLMTGAEAVFSILWMMLFLMFYKSLFPPRKMLLVEGSKHDYYLQKKISGREDKYQICEVVSYTEGWKNICGRLELYDSVIIGDMPSHERNVILKYCFEQGIRSYTVPKISDILLKSSAEIELFDTPLYLSRNIGLTIEQDWAKRMEDMILASLMLVCFSPIFILVAIAIKCTDGGPILYTQERLTLKGRRFQIYKFRTMIMDAEDLTGPVLASEKDPRILPVGRFLRTTRLDELPQLFNILKGEMSLVGPRPERPELAEAIEKEIPEFSYRLKVKAGLTGYAQIYGKYNTSEYDKLKLDLTYIRQYSFLLDMKLIIMTLKIMFMKESAEGIKKNGKTIKKNDEGKKD